MKPTSEEKVKIDVTNYLHNKYHQDFDVLNSEWICNTGNGCPDGHVVTCFPINNPDIKFRLDIVYNGKDFKIQRDEYKIKILNYQAGIEIEKLLSSKVPLFEKDVAVLTYEKQLAKYNPLTINYEKVINDYPQDITLSIQVYILENDSLKRNHYLSITKEILNRFFPLPLDGFSLYLYFYNENKYTNMSRDEIKHIFETEEISQKDPQNCQKEWAMDLDKKKISNTDSVLNNLESYIHEYNYKK